MMRGRDLESLAHTQRRLVDQIRPLDTSEPVALAQALGRFLASAVCAPVDVPPQDVSLYDGYAFDGSAEIGTHKTVLGLSFAGDAPPPLQLGTAMRIFTGSILPAGASTVVAQESIVSMEQGGIQFKAQVVEGAGIRPRGADSRAGTLILAAGTRLDAPQLGLLASVGVATVSVVRRPRVAVFTTGSELVAPGTPLSPGKIYNANHPVLIAALSRLGVDILDLGCLPDQEAALRAALAQAATQADLVLTSGGVSVGDADLVRSVVESLGRIDQWRVFLKPGKPLAFGQIAGTPFIGLPGNPVSTFVTFFLFVRPVLRVLMGGDPEIDRPPVQLPLAAAWSAGDRPEFVRVRRVPGRDGKTHLALFENQNSGLLSSIAWADGVALMPADRALRAGELVDYFSFESWYL